MDNVSLVKSTTSGERAIVMQDDNDMVLAINWGIPRDEESDIAAAIRNGNDCHIADHMLDEPVDMDEAMGNGGWEVIASSND